jgi:copper chaperone CopZ
MLIKSKLKVDGMHCGSCAMSIDGELEDTEGIKESNTNYVKGQTEVLFETDRLTLDTIISIIKNVGYTAQSFDN